MGYLEGLKGASGISVREALGIIDANNKGFVVIVGRGGRVEGVATDGDIRRAILRGCRLDGGIDGVMQRGFKSLRQDEGLEGAVELFKDGRIGFLPIVDGEGRLVNVITKRQLHALLLQDIPADLGYDFSTVDEGIVDHEVFPRPWGFYKTTVYNEYYQSKVISVRPGGRLSLQSHGRREEHWVVVHGSGTAQIEGSEVKLSCGSCVFIPRGCRHRLANTDGRETLIVAEVQIGDYLGEDDIRRYEDIYGRA